MRKQSNIVPCFALTCFSFRVNRLVEAVGINSVRPPVACCGVLASAY